MPKKAEQLPEGWVLLGTVNPGEVVRWRFKDWKEAQGFMEFNGVLLYMTHTFSVVGDDPTVLRERYWLRRGTWRYAMFERRVEVVAVAVDARYKKVLSLGTKGEVCAAFVDLDTWLGA